jgi:hypothetical protein
LKALVDDIEGLQEEADNLCDKIDDEIEAENEPRWSMAEQYDL